MNISLPPNIIIRILLFSGVKQRSMVMLPLIAKFCLLAGKLIATRSAGLDDVRHNLKGRLFKATDLEVDNTSLGEDMTNLLSSWLLEIDEFSWDRALVVCIIGSSN